MDESRWLQPESIAFIDGSRTVKRVHMTTDGACIGNPGPGGWACILRYFDRKKEIFGSEENTTNNRMELRAVIEGLKMLREPCEVVMVTDSQYVKKGMTEWLGLWKARDWRDRKSTRLNSSHTVISYAVFCLK